MNFCFSWLHCDNIMNEQSSYTYNSSENDSDDEFFDCSETESQKNYSSIVKNDDAVKELVQSHAKIDRPSVYNGKDQPGQPNIKISTVPTCSKGDESNGEKTRIDERRVNETSETIECKNTEVNSERENFSCNDNINNDFCGEKSENNRSEREDGNIAKNYSIEDIEEIQIKIVEIKEAGNAEFKRKNYAEAEKSYTEALGMCPANCPDELSREKAILHANRAASLMRQEKKNEAISDCDAAIELDPVYIKALLRRAELHEICDKPDNALEDFKRVLEIEPSNGIATAACARLPPLIEARNEKLKAEMLGTLKDLGNKVLGKFGLSTDNFQLQQNPETGSYNIQFKQNP